MTKLQQFYLLQTLVNLGAGQYVSLSALAVELDLPDVFDLLEKLEQEDHAWIHEYLEKLHVEDGNG